MTLPRRFTRSLAALAGVASLAALVFTAAVAPAMAAEQRVEIVGVEFRPREITIGVGDTVTWEVTQTIGSPHSVTSGTPGDADAGALFDSGIEGLEKDGETFEHTFEEAGTFAYYCVIHASGMRGTIIVAEAGASAPASPAASAAASAPSASGEPSAGASPQSTVGTGSAESPPPGTGPLEPTQIPADRRALAAGILAVAIVIMFGGAAVWRRMNPA